MAKQPDPYLRNTFSQVCGLIVAVGIMIPPLLRLAGGGWKSDDWVLIVLGSALSIVWVTMMGFAARQRRREREELRPPGSE